MVVRFRFRSSLVFDSVDIGGRPSISVCDLRARILHHKSVNIGKDFDLVICDAGTEEAFEDENHQVLDGSSLIIKRVPSGTPDAVPSLQQSKSTDVTDTKHANVASQPANYVKQTGYIHNIGQSTLNVEMEEFDDFGLDICALDATLSDSDQDANGKNNLNNECSNLEQTTSKLLPARCHFEPEHGKPPDSDYRGRDNWSANELQANPNRSEHLNEEVNSSSLALAYMDLPLELRCPLCNRFLNDAVMIPCCQHSFCNKCIKFVLSEGKCCPKCSSGKYTIADLLPNLSLRQAMECFQGSQMRKSGSGKLLPKYAPDEESRIQALEVSCALPIHQRELSLPHSPTVTCEGSNQVTPESVGDLQIKRNRDAVASVSHPICLASKKRKESWISPADGSGCFNSRNKRRGAHHTCYMCGSLDHLVRNCPSAFSQYPVFHAGCISPYGMPYWSGTGPFGCFFSSHGVMPYDPATVPLLPYSVPHLQTYGCLPLQWVQKKGVGDLLGGHFHNGPKQVHDQKVYADQELRRSCSKDSCWISWKKHPDDKQFDTSHLHGSEYTSEGEDLSQKIEQGSHIFPAMKIYGLPSSTSSIRECNGQDASGCCGKQKERVGCPHNYKNLSKRNYSENQKGMPHDKRIAEADQTMKSPKHYSSGTTKGTNSSGYWKRKRIDNGQLRHGREERVEGLDEKQRKECNSYHRE